MEDPPEQDPADAGRAATTAGGDLRVGKRQSLSAATSPSPKKARTSSASSPSSSATEKSQQQWYAMLERLKAYKEQHNGSTAVPYRYKEDTSLANWVRSQRQRYATQKLQEDRMKALEELGFEFVVNADNGTPNKTTATAAAEGTTTSPISTTAAAHAANGEFLNPPKGLNKEERWEWQFAKLKAWKEKHGHYDVPVKFPQDQTFSNWVRMQRDMYNYPTRGNLREDRVERLNDIGFDWKSPKQAAPVKSFDDYIELLTKHKEEHGHIKIGKGKSLGNWLAKQKELYHENKLAAEEIQALEALDIDWTLPTRGKSFEEYITILTNYKEENGDIKVGKGKKGLGSWLAKQRELYHEQRLTAEQIKALDNLGMDWTLPPSRASFGAKSFEEYTAMLAKHKEEHGDIKGIKGRSLANWVATQKELYHEQKLTEEQIQALEDAGIDDWTLPPRKRTWEEQLAVLVAFKIHNGHSNVPSTYTEDPSLRNWVVRQREWYHAGKMDDWQVKQLAALDFDFSLPPRRKTWEELYETLEKYKEDHGNTNVPVNYEPDPELAKWVARQKELYSKKKLSDTYTQKLQALSFDFSLPKKLNKWEENYVALLAYKEKHGDINQINSFYKEKPNLCHWVARQRDLRFKEKLQAERVAALDQLGIDWTGPRRYRYSKDEVWYAHFELLHEFQQKHGHCGIPSNFPDDPDLLDWIHRQHVAYAKNRMPEDRMNKLKSIGFVFQDIELSENGDDDDDDDDEDRKMPARRTSVGSSSAAARTPRVSWKQHYDGLKLYKETYGDFNVPVEYDGKLAEWVRQQRRAFKKGKGITDQKIEMLQNIGFNWDGPDESVYPSAGSGTTTAGASGAGLVTSPIRTTTPLAAAAAARLPTAGGVRTGTPYRPTPAPPLAPVAAPNSTVAIAAAAAAAATRTQKEEDRLKRQELLNEVDEMRLAMNHLQEVNQSLSKKLQESETARKEEKIILENAVRRQEDRLRAQQSTITSQSSQIAQLSQQMETIRETQQEQLQRQQQLQRQHQETQQQRQQQQQQPLHYNFTYRM